MWRTVRDEVFGAVRRRPRAAAFNLVALGVYLASAMAIGVYLWNEHAYDWHHRHAREGRLYRLTFREIESRGTPIRGALAPPPFGPTLAKEFPDLVEAVARCRRKDTDIHYGSPIVQSPTLARSEQRFYWVDPSFFDVFTVRFVAGDPKTALVNADTVVLSESMARAYFGDPAPIGQTLTVDDAQYRVTGVVEDPPANTHLHMDFMASMESVEDSRATYWIKNNYFTYVLLRPNVSAAQFQVRLDYVFAQYFDADLRRWLNFSLGNMARNGNHLWFSLYPVTDIHLTPHDFEAERHGSAAQVSIVTWAAAVLVVIAMLNFTSFLAALDRFGRRVGVRAALLQGLVYGLATTAIVIPLAAALLPFTSALRSDTHRLSLMEPAWTIPFAAAAICVALMAASCARLLMIRGERVVRVVRLTSAGAQFAAAAGAVLAALLIGGQTYYMATKPLGITRDPILVLRELDGLRERMQAFKADLRAHPSVLAVSDSSTLPGRQFRGKSHSLELDAAASDFLTLWQVQVDEGFADTYGLRVKEGRFFSRDRPKDVEGAVINETAARLLGLRLGTTIYEHAPGTPYEFKVIGIVEDFHVASMRREIAPVTMKLVHYQPRRVGRFVAVRPKDGQMDAALAHVERVWRKYLPARTVEHMMFADDYGRLLEPELETAGVVGGFAALALVGAAWSLLGIVVAGALAPGGRGLARPHLLLGAVGAAAGMPLGYRVASDWIDGFAYRTDAAPWAFVATPVLIVLVAWFIGARSAAAAAGEPGPQFLPDLSALPVNDGGAAASMRLRQLERLPD